MRAFFAILAAGLAVQAAPAAAQEIMEIRNMDGSCGGLYRGPSPMGQEMKKVTFVNKRDALVWPAWINLAGFVGVYPEEIPPGGTYSTYTKVGHRWLMIDGTNWHCIQHITIEGDTARYEID